MISRLKDFGHKIFTGGTGFAKMYLTGKAKDIIYVGIIITLAIILVWGWIGKMLEGYHATRCDDMMIEIMGEIRKDE